MKRTVILVATTLALLTLATTSAVAQAMPRHSFQIRFGYFFPEGEGLLWDDAGDPTLPIYFGTFKESGEALEARVLAGLELPLAPGFSFLVEGRYTWAQGQLSRDLADLESIDLGGAWGFVGASFRF